MLNIVASQQPVATLQGDDHIESGNFIAAYFDRFIILIPSADIFSLESSTDLNLQQADNTCSIGSVTRWGYSLPVYALNERARFTKRNDTRNRVLLLLSVSEGIFSIACRAIKLVENSAVLIEPIPICMQQKNSSYRQMAVLDDLPAYVVSKQTLWHSLQEFGATAVSISPASERVAG